MSEEKANVLRGARRVLRDRSAVRASACSRLELKADRHCSTRMTLSRGLVRSGSRAAAQNQRGEHYRMDEGRKRVLTIVAGILVARHLKTPEDLGDSRPSPRTENLASSVVQWADRIYHEEDRWPVRQFAW